MNSFNNITVAREFLIKKGYYISPEGIVCKYNVDKEWKPKPREKRAIKFLEKYKYTWKVK